VANPENGPDRQTKKVDVACRDVLSEVARTNTETLVRHVAEEFLVDEVYLSKIGLGWICFDSRTMLNERSLVSIASDPDAGYKLDLGDRIFAEGMNCGDVSSANDWLHNVAWVGHTF